LSRVDGDKADLYVGYQTAVSKEENIMWYSLHSATTLGGITLYVGQLVIDLYDAATEALVWRGAVSKTINRGKTRETTEKPGEDDRKTSEELSIKDESLGVFCNLF